MRTVKIEYSTPSRPYVICVRHGGNQERVGLSVSHRHQIAIEDMQDCAGALCFSVLMHFALMFNFLTSHFSVNIFSSLTDRND